MHVSVLDHVCPAPDRSLHHLVGEDGGIGVVALVADEVALAVLGVGIARRKVHLSRVGDVEQRRITSVLAAGLGLDPHQHVRDAVPFTEIREQAGVTGMPGDGRSIEEAGIIVDLDPGADALVEIRHKGRVALVRFHYQHRDVIVLRNAEHIAVDDAIEDGRGRAGQHGQGRDEEVVGYRGLDAPQLELQRDVAVDREAVGPDLHAVQLLAVAELGGNQHEIDAYGQRQNRAVHARERVEAPACQLLERGTQELRQQRQADEHGQERHVYHAAVERQVVELVQLQVDVGIEDYAAEGGVGIQHNGRHRQKRGYRE